jgi:hypothetical protein
LALFLRHAGRILNRQAMPLNRNEYRGRINSAPTALITLARSFHPKKPTHNAILSLSKDGKQANNPIKRP